MEYMEELEKSTAGVEENAVRNKFNKYIESMQTVDDIVSDLNKALHRINNVQSEFYYVTQITSDSEPDEVEFKIMLDDDVIFEFDAEDVG
jgi:outer membrane lipoprotein-sorting protein